jgi:hypothetical protein
LDECADDEHDPDLGDNSDVVVGGFRRVRHRPRRGCPYAIQTGGFAAGIAPAAGYRLRVRRTGLARRGAGRNYRTRRQDPARLG